MPCPSGITPWIDPVDVAGGACPEGSRLAWCGHGLNPWPIMASRKTVRVEAWSAARETESRVRLVIEMSCRLPNKAHLLHFC